MSYWLILIPFISAIVGWIIHSLAIKMLFRPYQPKKILGITLQGIFPKRQQAIAQRLGKFASSSFPLDGIEQKITNPDNLQQIMPLIEEHIDDFLRNRLKEEMPMISMFIGDKTITNLKAMFLKEIETLLPMVMKKYAANLKTELNLEQIITQKVAAFPADKLEAMMYEGLSKEIRSIKMIGAAIGFIIGVIQVLITLLID